MEDAYGNFRVAGADGLIGVGIGHDGTMEGAIRKAYEKVKKINLTGNKQFWPLSEHLEAHADRYKTLRRWGVITT